MKTLTVHIIGGTGKMGQWLKSFLENDGIHVTVVGRDYEKKNDLVRKADITVVSVPISETEKVLRYVMPRMPKGALLTDMTSVKAMPVNIMREATSGALGMHPLFGPTVGSMTGQKIVFCKITDTTHVKTLQKLFEKSGIEIIEMSEEEHDYQVAYIQALTHATHLLYAKTILGQEKTIMTKLQTPTFAIHALAMGRILSQDIEMMADIQLYNPYFTPVFDNLMENAKTLIDILQTGNRKKFIKFFEGEAKKAKNFSGLSLFQTNRILRLISDIPTNLPEKGKIKNVFKKVTISYLGPEGTYSHQAVIQVFNKKADNLASSTIFGVFQNIAGQNADFGVVPAENSIEGTVRSTMDYLVEFSLYVCGSFELSIHHQLLTEETKLSDITTVVSHPQALAQCKNWLKEKLPRVKIVSTESTTAQLKTPKKGYAYIASADASQKYKVPAIAKNIEDDPTNTTRFYVISKNPMTLKGIQNSKTLLFATVYNRVGILRDILNVFTNHNINLTKLESRPSHEKMWDYHFFIEVEKNHYDKELVQTLHDLEMYCPVIRVLGQT